MARKIAARKTAAAAGVAAGALASAATTVPDLPASKGAPPTSPRSVARSSSEQKIATTGSAVSPRAEGTVPTPRLQAMRTSRCASTGGLGARMGSGFDPADAVVSPRAAALEEDAHPAFEQALQQEQAQRAQQQQQEQQVPAELQQGVLREQRLRASAEYLVPLQELGHGADDAADEDVGVAGAAAAAAFHTPSGSDVEEDSGELDFMSPPAAHFHPAAIAAQQQAQQVHTPSTPSLSQASPGLASSSLQTASAAHSTPGSAGTGTAQQQQGSGRLRALTPGSPVGGGGSGGRRIPFPPSGSAGPSAGASPATSRPQSPSLAARRIPFPPSAAAAGAAGIAAGARGGGRGSPAAAASSPAGSSPGSPVRGAAAGGRRIPMASSPAAASPGSRSPAVPGSPVRTTRLASGNANSSRMAAAAEAAAAATPAGVQPGLAWLRTQARPAQHQGQGQEQHQEPGSPSFSHPSGSTFMIDGSAPGSADPSVASGGSESSAGQQPTRTSGSHQAMGLATPALSAPTGLAPGSPRALRPTQSGGRPSRLSMTTDSKESSGEPGV